MDQTLTITPHAKRLLTLRSILIGRGYHRALIALEYARSIHTGTRRDGLTPEFDHQVIIALFCLTLPDLMFEEEVITTVLLHDVREDFDITDGEIRALFEPGDFTDRVATAVAAMTKTFRGAKRDPAEVFASIAASPVASIAKLGDRIHNFQSMIGVFSPGKQRRYIAEGLEFFLPMLKEAKRRFPQQLKAYQNLKFVLVSQMELITAMLDATAINAE